MALASTDDVAARLGVSALSAEQAGAATLLLDLATAVVVEAVDKDADWAAALSPVPDVLRGLTVELVCRAMASPQGLTSASVTLGEATRTETYRRDPSSPLVLTTQEQLLARGAVYGTTSGSSTPRALPDRLNDLAYLRDVDELVY